MSIVAEALQSLIPEGILNGSGKSEKTTASDTIVLGRTGYDLAVNADGSLILDFRDDKLLTYALCCDCSRFASASFQSLGAFSSEKCDRLSFPWDLIKLYYAAFYAAHSIMRLAGQSCSYLNETHTKRLNEFLAASGAPSSNVSAGLYHGRLIANSTQIHLSKIGGRFGGSHEEFWKVFAGFLRELSTATLQGPMAAADAQQVFAKLDEAVGLLRHKGASYGRLSTIRNELQYRHGYEGWQPSTMRKAHYRELIHLALQWKFDPMSVRLTSGRLGDLGEFTSACAFIVGFCRSAAERVAERSSAGRRSFLRFAAMRALEDCE